MAHMTLPIRLPLLIRVAALSALATAVPAAVNAQSLPQVRVVTDATTIRSGQRGRGDALMTAEPGTVLEAIDTDGDRYSHQERNWYLVLLPRDPWGARRTGWISARDVEPVPVVGKVQVVPVPVVSAPALAPANAEPVRQNAGEPLVRATEVRRTAAAAAAAPMPLPEVVLNFEFGRSDLTADAKARLTDPTLRAVGPQGLSFALEGHADWVGSQTYNEQLGLARAENVRKYLTETLQIPADRMSVASFGEGQPAAPNTTDEGRAQNRRVVIRVRP